MSLDLTRNRKATHEHFAVAGSYTDSYIEVQAHSHTSDINEWYEAISLLEDFELRKSLSINGLKELKSKYAWTTRAQNVGKLLEKY